MRRSTGRATSVSPPGSLWPETGAELYVDVESIDNFCENLEEIEPLTRRLQSRYAESVPQYTAPSIMLPPARVIEAYKKDIDRTLLREDDTEGQYPPGEPWPSGPCTLGRSYLSSPRPRQFAARRFCSARAQETPKYSWR